MVKPRKSGGAWRQRQEKDPYVQMARRDGWRSRAVYKLAEINDREALLRPGMTCIDLGAAPGGWSQYVRHRLGQDARLIAVDLLPIEPLPAVQFVEGDFTDDDVLRELEAMLGDARADLVMSDMAPNISGHKAIDQPKSMYLAELALELAKRVLGENGDFVCKLFQGRGTDEFVAVARQSFAKVKLLKPKASRPDSSEVYLVARNYQL